MRFLSILTDIVLVSTVLSSIRRATDIEFPVHRIRNAMARWFVMQLLGMGDVVVDLIIEIVKQNPKLFVKRVSGSSGNGVRGDGGALNSVAGVVGVGQPMLVELPHDGVSDTHQQIEIDGTSNHPSTHGNDTHTHHMVHIDRNTHHNQVVAQQQHVQYRGRSMSRTRLPSTHLHQQPSSVSVSSTRSSPIPQYPLQVSQMSPVMQAYQPSSQPTRFTGTPTPTTTSVTNSRCTSPSHQNQLNPYIQPSQYQQYQPVVYGYQHKPPSRHHHQQQSQLSGDVKSKIQRRNVSRSQSPHRVDIDEDEDVKDTPTN